MTIFNSSPLSPHIITFSDYNEKCELIHCLHCGHTRQVASRLPVESMIKILQHYIVEHRDCHLDPRMAIAYEPTTLLALSNKKCLPSHLDIYIFSSGREAIMDCLECGDRQIYRSEYPLALKPELWSKRRDTFITQHLGHLVKT